MKPGRSSSSGGAGSRIHWAVRFAALALAGSGVHAEPAPADDYSWFTAEVLTGAANLLQNFQYKPIDTAAASGQVREAAAKLSRDPPGEFDKCFAKHNASPGSGAALSSAVQASLVCLKIDRADQQGQLTINKALFEAMAKAADPGFGLLPPSMFEKPFANPAKTVSPSPLGGGIGLSLSDDDGGKRIVDWRYSSPAWEQGIVRDDLIVAIDGRPAAKFTLDEAAQALQGEPGTSVALLIRPKRGGADRLVTLQRKPVGELNNGFHFHRAGDLLVVDIRSMEGGESARLEKVWRDQGAGAKGLVLDLRFNGGGTLDEAVALADTLLERGRITTIEARSAKDRQVFEANSGAIAGQARVIVLIGPNTAAGAEILAAALHDNGRATLVGQKSFGRGSIQSLFYLSRRVPIKITTGEALQPDGTGIDQIGLIPDCATDADGTALIEIARKLAAGQKDACPATR